MMPFPRDCDPEFLFDKHPEAMWVYDRQSLRFLAVNEVAISRYGYTRDEFLTMTIADIRPREEQDFLLANLASATGESFERSGLWRHVRKSGETLHVEVISNAITFAGQPARLVIARDAAARASIESNLHQAQSRLRLASWELDPIHDTVSWPPRVYELVGVDPQSFSNTREAFLDLVHPEDRTRYIAAQRRAISERTPFDEEFRIQHPSGELRFLHEVGEVILRNDRPVFSAVIQDITDVVTSRAESQRVATQLRDVIEGMSDGFYMLDREWRFFYVNGQVEALLGHSREELEGTTLWEMFPGIVGTGFETLFRQARASGVSQRLTEHYAPLERWFEVTVHPGNDGMGVYFRDVTEEMRIQQQRRLLDTAIQKLGEVVLITEADPITPPDWPRIIYANDAITTQTGYTPEEVIGQTPRIFQGPETEGPELARLRSAIAEQRPEKVELVNYSRTRIPYWVELNLSPVTNKQGTCTHFIAIERDITDRKKTENALVTAATRDELTGLSNRLILREALKRHLEELQDRSKTLALLLMDLDNFKNVNDTLGHHYGDALLADVAKRITRMVRGSDTVARMSGDEFMVLVPGSTAEDAARLAQRLLDTFRAPFTLDGGSVAITASIGIVFAPQDGDDPETLIRNVDIALYRSKYEGRNMFTRFEARMREDVVRRTSIEQGLQRSLLADNDDFRLVYQPQVTCDATRRVVGAEALLRWKGLETGPVGPAEFVPIAEATGLIRPLDHMVIERAARQIAAWARDGIAVPVSVNVSAVSLQTEGFADEVLQRLDEHDVPRSLFQIEIVETVYLDESRTTDENLALFGQAGIRISIDDFGTGHSSLSYLRRLPVRYLKMDRGFVEHIGIGSKADEALAEAILAMACALKVDVIAEGVETDLQFDWLAQKGCPQVQGFLTGRPLEPERFAEHLREQAVK